MALAVCVPALGDRDARDGRGDRLGLAAVLGARLGVEGLELAGTAGHPEQDAGHPVSSASRRPGAAIQSVKLSGTAAVAARPAAPRPIVRRKCRRPITPVAAHRHLHQFSFMFHGHGLDRWSRFDSASPPGDELGRIDQAPVDVLERLAAVADGGQVPAADLDLLRRGLAGEHAEVQGVRAERLSGAAARISPSTVPGRAVVRLLTAGRSSGRGPGGSCPGRRRWRSRDRPRRADRTTARGPPRRMRGAGLLAAREAGSPAASTAFLAALRRWPAIRLGSPRLTGAALAWALARGFLLFWAGRTEVAVGVQRQAQGLGQGFEDLVGAEPAGASRGERGLAGRAGRRADPTLIGLGVEDGPVEPADVVAPALPLIGQRLEHLGGPGRALRAHVVDRLVEGLAHQGVPVRLTNARANQGLSWPVMYEAASARRCSGPTASGKAGSDGFAPAAGEEERGATGSAWRDSACRASCSGRAAWVDDREHRELARAALLRPAAAAPRRRTPRTRGTAAASTSRSCGRGTGRTGSARPGRSARPRRPSPRAGPRRPAGRPRPRSRRCGRSP